MFSKILVKLIDQSIIPAITLIAARIISVVLVANYFGVEYSFGVDGFTYYDPASYILVNSYSMFFMIVVLAVGVSYILLKSLIFHETHIAPKLTAHLFSLKLSSFIQASYDLYSQGAVWLSYLYLMTLVTGLMSFFGLIYAWVFFVSLALTIASTILLIFDIENEIDLKKETQGTDIEEEIVLNLRGLDE
jgi:hypothetical protein